MFYRPNTLMKQLKVKKVTITKLQFKFGNPTAETKFKVEEYSEIGSIIKEVGYTGGEIQYSREYSYNSEGRLKEDRIEWQNVGFRKHDFYREIGRLGDRQLFSYNEKGFLSEVAEFNEDDKLIGKRTIRYDNSGNIIEEIKYGHQCDVDSKSVIVYDAIGNKIEEQIIFGGSRSGHKYFYKYNSKGEVISKISSEPDTIWYDRDSLGNVLKQTTSEAFRDNYSYIIDNYSKQGKLILSKTFNSSGSLDFQKAFEYDSSGMIISYSFHQDENGKKIAYSYDRNHLIQSYRELGSSEEPKSETKFSYTFYDK